MHAQHKTTLEAEQQMVHLVHSSRENEDFVLETPFTSEEIDSVLHNSKPGKSAGHDQVQPEHLKYGGAALSLWIKQVANAIIELESVPQSLKLGIVTPSVQGRWQRSFRHQQLPWHHGITSPSQSVGVSDPWMAEWCAG